MSVDLVFRNATVIDGTGTPGYVADVSVAGDRIAEVGSFVGSATTEIDATGLVLAPGFIDVHTHDDFALLSRPEMSFKTLQGVTTVVTGNCGTSAVPLGEWADKVVAARPATNVVALVGHGSVREAVMGRENTAEPDSVQMDRMVDLVDSALDAGASGISTGLVYVPGTFSSFDEVIALTRPVAQRGGIYTSHIRNEGGGLLESIEEAMNVGRVTGIKVQISHLKAIGAENFSKIPEAIARIKAAQHEGLSVMADQYPYTRGSTLLDQLVARGALDGPSPFGFVQGEDVLIAAAPHFPDWEGQTLDVIARSMDMTVPEVAQLAVSTHPESCFIVYRNQSEENVERILREDFVMIGSDGVPFGSKPHPRLHHTYPRVIGEYSRNRSIIPIHVAVHKMTGMCAERFAIRDRGTVAAGRFADLVLFDPSLARDTGDYADPTTVPEGFIGTWVNGRCVARDGRATQQRSGRFLRTLD